MPHAETTSTTNAMAPVVNGDKPSSAFLSHLTSYPVVSDSISTFKSYPIGAKSIEISSNVYQTISKQTQPYLSKPYEYVSPYVAKADSIGDNTLSKIDEKIPFVKKSTSELYDNGKGLVFFPIKKGNEAKDYVLGVYGSEVKKVGGEGIVTYGKATVTTTLIVSSDALSWLSEFLSAKKEQAKESAKEVNEKINEKA